MENSKNIKGLFNAEVISLIGEILTVFGLIFFLATGLSISEVAASDQETLAGLALVGLVVMMIGAVLVFIAAILSLVKIVKLRNASKNFNNAFTWLIIVIILTVVDSIITNVNPDYAGISDIAIKITEFLMIYYVTHGCAELCNNAEITKLVKDVTIYIVIAVIASLVGQILAACGINETATSLFADLCTIVYYVMYLMVLSKSAKVLSK